jgi:pimeloyl-ACP methyl ester carboxylesterase
MNATERPSSGVLVLPGGKPRSAAMSRRWHLANQRMAVVAAALRRQLGDDFEVRRIQYRLRGWNGDRLSALRDAEAELTRMRREIPAERIILVGHSMGARVAAHLSAGGDVAGIVALAPWWPQHDADLVPTGCRMLVMHGTADTWTDPRASSAQTQRAAQRGVDAQWVPVYGAGHYMIRRWSQWHRRPAEYIADHFGRTQRDT